MISNFLNNKTNTKVREAFSEIIPVKHVKAGKTKDLIIDGIQESITLHTKARGSRTIAKETFVKNAVTAAVFKLVKEKKVVTNTQLNSLLGTTSHQVSIARNQVKDVIKNNATTKALQRKIRKEFIKKKLEPFLFDFVLDDRYTRLDTKQCLLDVYNPRAEEGEPTTEHRRIWLNAKKTQRFMLFLESDHYTNFQQEHAGATAGYKVWKQVMTKVGGFVK